MRAKYAQKKGRINDNERKRIEKLSRRLGSRIGLAAAVVAFLVVVFPLRAILVANAHRQYREHFGVVATAPQETATLGAGTHYVMRLRYPDWYGRTQEVLVATKQKLTVGERTLVVVNAHKAPWVAADITGNESNPYNGFELKVALIAGFVAALLIGFIGYGGTMELVDRFTTRRTIRKKEAKSLVRAPTVQG